MEKLNKQMDDALNTKVAALNATDDETGDGRVAALDHKAGDDAVEGQAVIKALIDQFQKVFAGDRCCGSIQFNVNGFAVLHRNTNHRC